MITIFSCLTGITLHSWKFILPKFQENRVVYFHINSLNTEMFLIDVSPLRK